MTHKTGALTGLNAILLYTELDMALGTVVHFHPVPSIMFESRDILSPYIPAVPCDSIFLVHFQGGGFTDVAMAGFAVHSPGFDMGRMGEKDTVRLLGIDHPRDLSARRHILVDKDGFVFGIPLNFLMAFDALSEFRDAGIAAVFPEKVAAFTSFIHQFVV
jgi:hypothetical protein